MPAFLLAIRDNVVQHYIEQHPFLTGPDVGLNARLRRLVVDQLRLRPTKRVAFESRTLDGEPISCLADEDRREIHHALAKVGVGTGRARELMTTLAWKTARVPREAERVLSIGCGDGSELVLLRALLPQARLAGIDFRLRVPQHWRAFLRAELAAVSMGSYLNTHRGAFDVVFSNHVLEHVPDPEELLLSIRGCLASGGMLVSALPLDGDASNPFYDKMLYVARTRPQKGLELDLGYLDPGHRWKTNVADLVGTLREVGFRDIAIWTRSHYPSYVSVPSTRLAGLRRKGQRLDALLLQPLRTGLRRLFPECVPETLIRSYYSLERRFWFGPNRLKNTVTAEVLFVAGT